MNMFKKIIALIVIVLLILIVFYSGIFDDSKASENKKPIVEITYPLSGATVSKIVTICGTAMDPDGDDSLLHVEIMVENRWDLVAGNTKWSYEWIVYEIEDGSYTIKVRSWDGSSYSNVEEVTIIIDNPEIVESDSHKWAIFIAASNFPKDNESKLGNGALNLAEEMTDYFVQSLNYPTSGIFILFDDGWIRSDNGYGMPIETLEQRKHHYDITYGAATKETVSESLKYIVEEANRFRDSEVFIWIASHGLGDSNKKFTGGKILKRSAIFLWDEKTLTDKQLADALSNLQSTEVCIIVDACFSGGFADKTILNLPEFSLLRARIPRPGRVVMTGASKYRVGYTSTTNGPLFSQLWFKGLKTGEADGFRPGIFKRGRPTRLRFFKDGKVSAEEAFYYARYVLRTDKTLDDYDHMQPQINDQYPYRGFIRSLKGLILGG
jgi:hypothetical protein